MVDYGVLRLNEAQQVNVMLNKDLGVNLAVVDASALFLKVSKILNKNGKSLEIRLSMFLKTKLLRSRQLRMKRRKKALKPRVVLNGFFKAHYTLMLLKVLASRDLARESKRIIMLEVFLKT